MILDASSLNPGSVLNSRYCVIGSGMGGATLARRLAAAGKDVLLVEAGGLEPRDGPDAPVAVETAGRPFGLPITRSVELGGSSSRWHGICGRLDPIDFESRPWVADSGWPIRLADLEPWYDAAARELDAPHPPLLGGESAIAGRFQTRLADLDFSRSLLQNKIVGVPTSPRRWKDILLPLARGGGLRCLINAPALELDMDGTGETAGSLIAGAGSGTVSIRAEVFAVCAGALETPRLLLNSRRRIPAGIGNSRGLVGRYLSDHPMGHFCKLGFARRTRAPMYASAPAGRDLHLMAGLMASPEQQRLRALPNHYLWLRPSVSPRRVDDALLLSFLSVRSARDLSPRQVAAILTNADIRYRILVHRFGLRPSYRYGDMFFMTEQLPNTRSRVLLSESRADRFGYPVARIDWQLSDADFQGFESFTRLLFDGLQSSQYRIARVDPMDVWRRTVTSAAHHLGSARMAATPDRGVVDTNLRVFGTRNVFVCDGSVFPTAGSVNPSLTIVSLALRLADHLLRC